jgi:hypothetical protein
MLTEGLRYENAKSCFDRIIHAFRGPLGDHLYRTGCGQKLTRRIRKLRLQRREQAIFQASAIS